ncbi:sensor histidine kinase [Taibaiella soli]|uniref:histidine kinase n=1 Tax=Taibaiella soli TaxID=1649169 RepID=A0A2W2AD33_9BACT|nr:ATP-binding protein [Taibaiella soli]PZF73355.1 hypothetical protein DN068_08165 [Taibaiella soli]
MKQNGEVYTGIAYNNQPYFEMTRELSVLKQMASMISSLVWVCDVQQNSVVFVSPRVEAQLGWTDMTNVPAMQFWNHILPKGDQVAIMTIADAAMTNAEYTDQPLQCSLKHRDGTSIPYAVRCSLFKTADAGDVLVFTAEKTETVEQLEKAHQDIEEKMAAQLEELNRSNQELEEFAYVASHDLQEPLRKISTFSGRIQSKYGDLLQNEGKMYLDRILVATEDMRTLIDNLLDFSRVIRADHTVSTVNLSAVVHDVVRDLELVIEETNTTITQGDLPKITGVTVQMKQLFTNIINNAIKFRKKDTPVHIDIQQGSVSAEEVARWNLLPEKKYFKITIADNGIGFEDEYAERIFKIFQRLHGKAEYPGSGIGLAICKKIVDYHQGRIYAENIAGQGARFTIILPEKTEKTNH